MVVAALAGGLIGLDRQVLSKPAGFRTHMLVAAGSALFVSTSFMKLGDAALVDGHGDAVRIPAAIVAGVGFLGAGAPLRSGERVSGLTTAAGNWVTAAVGVLIGVGFWVIGIAAPVILLIIVDLTAFASSRIGIGGAPDAPDTDS